MEGKIILLIASIVIFSIALYYNKKFTKSKHSHS